MSASDAFVKNNVPRDQYEANGGQTVFDYNFIIFNEEDLVVLKTTDPDTDNETTTQLAAGSDYSISNVGNEDGGTITLSSGANQGERYTIYRDTDIERLTDFLQSGAYESENVNLEYDEIYAILQELSRALSRAMTLPSEAPIDNINLPSPKSNGGLLAWPNGAAGGSGGSPTIIDPADEGDLNKINNFNIEVTEVTSDRDMNGNKIENLGDPVDPKDAVNLTSLNEKVENATTSRDMNNNKIKNLKDPTNNNDATNKEYVDDEITNADGDRNMNNNQIKNLQDPTDQQDAMTLNSFEKKVEKYTSKIVFPRTALPANETASKLIHTKTVNYQHALLRMGIIQVDPNDPSVPSGVKADIRVLGSSSPIAQTEKQEYVNVINLPENKNLYLSMYNNSSNSVDVSAYFEYI